MKIAILSRKASLYSTHRLVEAGEQRGHTVRVVDYLRCCMSIASHSPSVMYAGEPLERFDAVIPRIGASHTDYGTAVVRQFEMMDVCVVNSSIAISKSRDKLRCLQILANKGIGLPVTEKKGEFEGVDASPYVDLLGKSTPSSPFVQNGLVMYIVNTKFGTITICFIEGVRKLFVYIGADEF